MEGTIKPQKEVTPYKLQPYPLTDLLSLFHGDLDIDSSFYIPRLQGRILTTIEGIGLPEKQEKSIKDIVKTFFNETLTDIDDRKMETYRKMRDTLYEYRVLDVPKDENDLSITCFGQNRHHFYLENSIDNPDK